MPKNILLTGGCGFVGHHFIDYILRVTDWTITCLDRLTYAGDLNRLAVLPSWAKEGKRVEVLYHDFRSPLADNNLDRVTKRKPDYIIHMGAETHVGNSFSEPLTFASTNVIGTVQMLELARKLQPERFLYVSTDEVYGPVVPPALHAEGEPHRPSNPYSASKSGAEAFCRAYNKSFGTPVLITNTMNNYGERQAREKFIPKVMRLVDMYLSVPLHCAKDEAGNVTDISSRCWLHARDHAAGILFVLQRGIPGEQYNITGERADVLSVAEMIARFMGAPLYTEFVAFHQYSPGHDMHYGLDGSKLAALGWIPDFNLADSLEQVVRWTMAHKEWL